MKTVFFAILLFSNISSAKCLEFFSTEYEKEVISKITSCELPTKKLILLGENHESLSDKKRKLDYIEKARQGKYLMGFEAYLNTENMLPHLEALYGVKTNKKKNFFGIGDPFQDHILSLPLYYTQLSHKHSFENFPGFYHSSQDKYTRWKWAFLDSFFSDPYFINLWKFHRNNNTKFNDSYTEQIASKIDIYITKDLRELNQRMGYLISQFSTLLEYSPHNKSTIKYIEKSTDGFTKKPIEKTITTIIRKEDLAFENLALAMASSITVYLNTKPKLKARIPSLEIYFDTIGNHEYFGYMDDFIEYYALDWRNSSWAQTISQKLCDKNSKEDIVIVLGRDHMKGLSCLMKAAYSTDHFIIKKFPTNN